MRRRQRQRSATAARRPARSRSGYACPLRKAPCVPDCGDGIVTGTEQCDPGIAVEKNACSANCRWNPGLGLHGQPGHASATPTKCGDGKKEGAEGCDDGNTMPYDGCSATCQCRAAAARRAARPAPAPGKCGDGIVLARRGVRRRQQPVGRRLLVDLHRRGGLHLHAAAARRQHPGAGRLPRLQATTRPTDFEPGATGSDGDHRLRASSAPCSNAAGKPVFVARRRHELHHERGDVRRSGTRTSPASNHTTTDDADALEQRHRRLRQPLGPERRAVDVTRRPTTAATSARQLDACGNPIPARSTSADGLRTTPPAGQVCVQPCTRAGAATQACFARRRRSTGRPCSSRSTTTPRRAAARPSAANDPAALRSELDYPRRCRRRCTTSASPARSATGSRTTRRKTYKLDFLGDDDVWMFVNKRLAVDIGGIHTAAAGDDHDQRRPTRRPSG